MSSVPVRNLTFKSNTRIGSSDSVSNAKRAKTPKAMSATTNFFLTVKFNYRQGPLGLG